MQEKIEKKKKKKLPFIKAVLKKKLKTMSTIIEEEEKFMQLKAGKSFENNNANVANNFG